MKDVSESTDLTRHMRQAEVSVATADLVEVTGVTETAVGNGVGPMSRAQFSYRWALTPIGGAILGLVEDLPAEEVHSGEAVLVRYDDGWRIENLELSDNR